MIGKTEKRINIKKMYTLCNVRAKNVVARKSTVRRVGGYYYYVNAIGMWSG